MFDLLSGKPTSCERWVLENFTVSLQNDATYATFVPGRFGAATEACVASNREQFLRSFYAC
ncbi:Pre-mRNA-processing factor 39 [Durusdinium trenchii]